MSYGKSGYRRGYRAGTRPGDVGRVLRANKRPGPCKECGETIPAGAGHLWHSASGAWSVIHVPAVMTGWLMQPGPMVGGCPRDTDKRNAELHAAGHFGPDGAMPASEHERIAQAAASYAAANPARGHGLARGQLGQRGYVYSHRCEDAPCCGCCD